MNNNERLHDRRGSIPAVVGIATVLATLGAAALFMTNGMNRLDRRADLSRKAAWMASTAAEETILSLMNGSADWMTPAGGQKNIKLTYPAPATALMYGSTGALIDPVKVMGRRLDGAAVESQWRNKVYGALSAGPFWAYNHTEGWEAKLSPTLRRLVKAPVGVVLDPAIAAMYAAKYRRVSGDDKIAQAFAEEFKNAGGANASSVREALDKAGEKLAESAAAASCGNLAPDVGVLTAIGGLAFGRDAVEDKSAGKIGSLEELEAQPEEGAQAPEAPPKTASSAAEAPVDARTSARTIDTKRGPKQFSLTDFRQLSERGGVLRKDRYLVTIEAAASIEGASMEIEVPHVTHRVFARLHYGEAMLYAYGRMLAYIGFHYALEFDDFKKMGMVTEDGMLIPDKIMEAMEQAYTARPGPQAWPFAVATSIMRVAE